MDLSHFDTIELTQVAPSPNSGTISVQQHGREASASSSLLSRRSGLIRQPSQHHSDDRFAGDHVDNLTSIICLCSSCLHRKAFWKRQYRRLKGRPASYWEKGRNDHSSEEAQQPLFSCDSLLSYWAFEAPVADTGSTNSQTMGNLNDIGIRACEDDTISMWVGRVVGTLQRVIPDGLQLCAISEVRPQNEAKAFIRLEDRMRSFLLGEPNIRHLPVNLIMDIISHAWQMEIPPWSSKGAQDTIYGISRSLRLLFPPSKHMSTDLLGGSGGNHRPTRTWGRVPRHEGNMDPYSKDDELLLHWQLGAPYFWSDGYTYIKETHKKLPQPQYAKVMLSPKNEQNGGRLLIHFGHRSTFQEFTKRMNKIGAAQVAARTKIDDEEYWSSDAIVILSIITVFEIMVDHTTQFIQNFHRKAKNFSVECRRSPSTSKMKFSFHLEDHRRMSHAGVQRGLDILKTLEKWIEEQTIEQPRRLWDAGTPFETRIETLRKDLEFFDHTLKSLDRHLQDDRKQLQDRFQVTQDLRSFRIAILAAIFLPLSFTTSIFGMNMVTDIPDGPKGFSDWTQIALEEVPDNLLNATEILASVIGTSGALNYTWKSFSITAICLVMTLPLTLGMGVLLRIILSTQWSVVLGRGLAISSFLMIGAVAAFGHFASVLFEWGPPILIVSYVFDIIAIAFVGTRFLLQRRKMSMTQSRQRKSHWARFLFMSGLLVAIPMLKFWDTDSFAIFATSLILGMALAVSWLSLLVSMISQSSVL